MRTQLLLFVNFNDYVIIDEITIFHILSNWLYYTFFFLPQPFFSKVLFPLWLCICITTFIKYDFYHNLITNYIRKIIPQNIIQY